jgi:hypothetical protein
VDVTTRCGGWGGGRGHGEGRKGHVWHKVAWGWDGDGGLQKRSNKGNLYVGW